MMFQLFEISGTYEKKNCLNLKKYKSAWSITPYTNSLSTHHDVNYCFKQTLFDKLEHD